MKKFDWKNVLNEDEKKQVLSLQKQRESEQSIHHKLDLGFVDGEKSYAKHLLYWEDDQLVGYAWATSFDPTELELTLILSESTEDLTAVLAEIQRYAKEQSVTNTVLIADQANKFLADGFEKQAIEKQFSEYFMLLDLDKNASNEQKAVPLVSPRETDLPALEQLLGGSPLAEDLKNTRIYKEADQVLACIRLDEDHGNWGIFGFVVQEDQRGKGLGKQVLNGAIQLILESNPKSIYLEVETENKPAYHLYLSTGFDVRNQYDYYDLSK